MGQLCSHQRKQGRQPTAVALWGRRLGMAVPLGQVEQQPCLVMMCGGHRCTQIPPPQQSKCSNNRSKQQAIDTTHGVMYTSAFVRSY